MGKKLKPEIIEVLAKRLDKTPAQIRPRLSEIRRNHSSLTLNAAAQFYAQQQGISIMGKLDDEDRQSLGSIQSVSQVSSSRTIKIDKRTLNITNSPVHNLSFGDRTTLSQSVLTLDDSLAELLQAIDKSKKITPEEKEDYKSDLSSLASQIGKTKPNRNIIKEAWKGLDKLAAIEGCAELINRIAPLIQHFIK